jgi:membrane-bound ClpP family serine protease
LHETMSELGIITLLYAVGIGMLIAEIFIPSHGVLTFAGLGMIVWAVVRTFMFGGQSAGVVAVLACLILLPVFAYLCVKFWPHTPIGRRIAPPNPVATADYVGVPVVELGRYVGQTGRAISALRPVGLCEFDGRRFSCVAEFGMVDANATVVATGLSGGNLRVRVVEQPQKA